MFEDLLRANERYRSERHDPDVPRGVARGLAVVTCIDARLDPAAILGLEVGDAKVLRNAGARVTDDVLRSLVLATNLLGVTRVAVVQHTDCAVVGTSEDELRARVSDTRGVDATDWDFLGSDDQVASLKADAELIRTCPLLAPDVEVGAFLFDVATGELQPIST